MKTTASAFHRVQIVRTSRLVADFLFHLLQTILFQEYRWWRGSEKKKAVGKKKGETGDKYKCKDKM